MSRAPSDEGRDEHEAARRNDRAHEGLAGVGPRFARGRVHGWGIDSESWTDSTQAAVDAVMNCANTVAEIVLRLAEAVDELRDAPDV